MDTDRIKKIVEDTVELLGYELYKLEILHGGGKTIVRVFIDKPVGFVSVADCVKVSRALENKIDRFFDSRWFLEVSSAGIDRKITSVDDAKRYAQKFKGMDVEVLMKDGKIFEGKLVDVVDDELYLKKERVLWKDKKKVKIEAVKVQDIDTIRLKVKF